MKLFHIQRYVTNAGGEGRIYYRAPPQALYPANLTCFRLCTITARPTLAANHMIAFTHAAPFFLLLNIDLFEAKILPHAGRRKFSVILRFSIILHSCILHDWN
jgi:hypothetical protein